MGFTTTIFKILKAIANERKAPPVKLTPYVTANTAQDVPNELKEWDKGCRYVASGLNIPIGFEYRNGQGDTSRRKMNVHHFIDHVDGIRYVRGLCHARNEERTFRENRMSEVMELQTGEIHKRPSSFFDKYCLFDTPEKQKLQVLLHILMFLARADRRFAESEMVVLKTVISDHGPIRDRNKLEVYAFSKNIDRDEFFEAVDALEKMDAATIQYLVDRADEIIKSDGRVTPKEREMFAALKQFV